MNSSHAPSVSVPAAVPAARSATTPVAVRVALAGWGVMLGSATVGTLVTPGYSSAREFLSALASRTAPHPLIMVIGLLGLAVATLATAAALRGRLPGRMGGLAVGALGVAGLALLVAAGAREDCSSALAACAARERAGTVSGSHVIHELVSLLSFTLALVALAATASALRRAGANAGLVRGTRIAGLCALALVVAIGAGVTTGVGGLEQRVFLLLAYGWPLLVAVRLRPGAAR